MTEFWSDRAPLIKVGHGEDCLRVGDKADGLLLDAHLGDGGSAVVYRAVDTSGHRFAMKFLTEEFEDHLQADHPGDHRIGAYLGTELERTRQVNSEHVVDVLRASPVPRQSYLVMECLEGMTLLAYLREHLLRGHEDFPLSVEAALALLYQVACGLRDLHVAGFCHADVKPKNLYVTYRDDQPQLRHNPRIAAVLIDLGATERIDDGETRMIRQLTPEYCRPGVDPYAPRGIKDDWYAFSVVAVSLKNTVAEHIQNPMHIGSPTTSGALGELDRGLSVLQDKVPSELLALINRCHRNAPPAPGSGDRWPGTETATDSITIVRSLDHALRALTGQTGRDVVVEAPHPAAVPGEPLKLLPVVCTTSEEFTAVFADDLLPEQASSPTVVLDPDTAMKPPSTQPHRSPEPEPARPTEHFGFRSDAFPSPPEPSPDLGRETIVHSSNGMPRGGAALHWRTEDPTQWSVRDILAASAEPVPHPSGKLSLAEWAHRSDFHALAFIVASGVVSFLVVLLLTLAVLAILPR